MATKPGWYESTTKPHWNQWWDGKSWANAYWPNSLAPAVYLPDAVRFDISTQGEPHFDIVGENWREAEITAAMGGRPPRDIEIEQYVHAELVPEPDNPNDQHAVSVRISGFNVGYLPARVAPAYFPAICSLVSSGIVPTIRTRIWAVTRWSQRRNQDELKSAIRLALPNANELLPLNSAPSEPHYVIPRGRAVQVTGEEEHYDVIKPYIRPDNPSNVVVTLRPVEVPRGQTTATVLEVQLDGQRIGQLSPLISSSVMPCVTEADSLGRVAAAWGIVTGSRLAAEVTLRIAKAEAIPDTWPSSADVLPVVVAGGTPAGPAYKPQVQLGPAPQPSGLPVWAWVLLLIALCCVAAIPYVGWAIAILGLAGIIWWHIVLRRRPPKGSARLPGA